MLPTPTPAERRLEQLSDEQLALLSQRYPRRTEVTLQILAGRHLEHLQPLIAGLCIKHKLHAEDAEDASQLAYFWIDEARSRYHPAPGSRVAKFRTFLRRVVTSRFHNFASEILRHRSHQHPLAELTEPHEAARQPLDEQARLGLVSTGPESDPAELAATLEDWARVQEALVHLNPSERWLCLQVKKGRSISQLARMMHVSPREAARRVKEALAKLRALLERPR